MVCKGLSQLKSCIEGDSVVHDAHPDSGYILLVKIKLPLCISLCMRWISSKGQGEIASFLSYSSRMQHQWHSNCVSDLNFHGFEGG
jgi:hypothetical protein